MSEPKHIPEYFIDGNRAPQKWEEKITPYPTPDATGFPFDDNTQGEDLNTFDVELFNEKKRALVESLCVQPLGGHPDFYKILDEMKALYSAKHYQYATDADPMVNFRLCGDLIHKMLKPGIRPTIAAALCLMSKQIVGVYEIVGEGKTNTIESLQDKLRDIGIYSVILQILVAETQK